MTHQVDRGVELRNEFHAAVLAILYPGHGFGVGSLSELGGEGTEADVVARLLLAKAFHGFRLQLCNKTEKHTTCC